MFKLKNKKTFLHSVVPSKRVAGFGIQISDLRVRLHKFPHITFIPPDVVKPEDIQLKEKVLKSKYWTKRFFTLVAHSYSLQNLQSGFKYQLTRFGLDISYKLIWHLFRAQVDYRISFQRIVINIRRKMIREREELRENYPVVKQQNHEEFEKNLTLMIHKFRLADSGVSQLKRAGDFSGTKDSLTIDCITAPSTISFQNSIQPRIEETKISQVKIPPFNYTQKIVGSPLFIKIYPTGGSIEALTHPKIHHVAVNSLYVYSLGKKFEQKKKDAAEESENVIEIDLEDTLR